MKAENVKKELLNFLSTLSNIFNEDGELKQELLEVLKYNTGDVENDELYNNKMEKWLNLIEKGIVYDNDGEFYSFTDVDKEVE